MGGSALVVLAVLRGVALHGGDGRVPVKLLVERFEVLSLHLYLELMALRNLGLFIPLAPLCVGATLLLGRVDLQVDHISQIACLVFRRALLSCGEDRLLGLLKGSTFRNRLRGEPRLRPSVVSMLEVLLLCMLEADVVDCLLHPRDLLGLMDRLWVKRLPLKGLLLVDLGQKG